MIEVVPRSKHYSIAPPVDNSEELQTNERERDFPHAVQEQPDFTDNIFFSNTLKGQTLQASAGNHLLRKDLIPQWKLGSVLPPLLNGQLLTHCLHTIINTRGKHCVFTQQISNTVQQAEGERQESQPTSAGGDAVVLQLR